MRETLESLRDVSGSDATFRVLPPTVFQRMDGLSIAGNARTPHLRRLFDIDVSLLKSRGFVKRLRRVLQHPVRPDIHLLLDQVEAARPEIEIRL